MIAAKVSYFAGPQVALGSAASGPTQPAYRVSVFLSTEIRDGLRTPIT